MLAETKMKTTDWVTNVNAGGFCDVYVGRGTKFGNPYKIGQDGTRSQVVRMYADYLESHPDLVEAAKRELKGKILGCHCAPRSCHAEILARIANNQDR